MPSGGGTPKDWSACLTHIPGSKIYIYLQLEVATLSTKSKDDTDETVSSGVVRVVTPVGHEEDWRRQL